jgi:penicillin-binding protein 1C
MNLAALLAVLLIGAGCTGAPPAELPSFATVRDGFRPSDHVLLDRLGRPLHERRVDLRGRRLPWVALADVSPALINAVLAAEDQRFRSHRGVDVRALAGAAWQSLRGGGRRGGSTITMQLTSLLEEAPRRGPRTLREKLAQIAAARRLEQRWSKDEILEAYLNLVTFRGELQGVGAASELLFGIAPRALGAAQAVVLAASLRSPNAEPAALLRRSRALAGRRGVDDLDAVAHQVERVAGIPLVAPPRAQLAPHLAVQLLGGNGRAAVATTLDADVQRVAVESLHRHLLSLADRGVRDGAVLAVDNATGDVLAWVGSSGPLSAAPHVDGVRAPRQAGSTLKPFLYALAIEQRRLTAASLLRDSPLEVFVATGSYQPTNYDHGFRGTTSLRAALGSSLNVPAVRTLEIVGIDAFLRRLRTLGFATLDRSAEFYGPGLALGSGEVTLWDLVNAYRTLANGGAAGPLRTTVDGAGEISEERIIDPGAAFVITDILADREARAATFGLQSELDLPFPAAVKTGTSTDMRDNWCVGFSDRFTVGVWVGNFSGAPMEDVSGVSGAAPVWREVMQHLHREQPGRASTPPDGVVAVALAPGRREWFLRGTEPPAGRTLAATPRPRIAAPVDGAILAIDPDMPPQAQRMVFESRPATADLTWWLGDEAIGDAAAPVLWPPRPGVHRLQLRDAAGSEVDAVTFRVRAAAGAR